MIQQNQQKKAYTNAVETQLLICKLTYRNTWLTPSSWAVRDCMPSCMSVRLSEQASESGRVRQREGEPSDAGSCAGGEPGCGSSGTGGAERCWAGQRPEGQLETQRQPGGYRRYLPWPIRCLQSAQNLQSQ